MKAKEIRELSQPEIEQRIDEQVEHLQSLWFQHAIAQLEDPTVLRKMRREIARLKTILNERTRSEATADSGS